MNLIDLLKLIPAQVQILVVGVVLGGAAFAGAESRYLTVSQFEKSYILDLKAEIRDLRRELRDDTLTEREIEMLEDYLQELIAELCYEQPDDAECNG